MSHIENLQHSLAIVNEIGTKIDDALEKKKIEITAANGAASAAGELVKIHKEFMDKNKADLNEEIKAGKLKPEVAHAALMLLAKSHELVNKFLSDKVAQQNIKKGEAISLDANVKFLKLTYDSILEKKKAIETEKKLLEEAQEAKLKAALVEPPASFEEPLLLAQEVEKEKPKTRRKRPDTEGITSSTVKRIKDARRKRTS